MNNNLNSKSNFLQQSHLPWLDCIRFLAALMVLLCHFRGAFLPEWSWLPENQQTVYTFLFYAVTRLGNEAVWVFFVLSGFLVGGRAVDSALSGHFNIIKYSIDRGVRIMLPLSSALFLYILKEFICDNSINWYTLFGNLLSVQGIWVDCAIEPLWSLAYEVWFYIILGASMSLLFSRSTITKQISMLCLIVCFLVFTKLSVQCLLMWCMGVFTYMSMPKKLNKFILFTSSILLPLIIAITFLTSGGHVTSDWIRYLPTQNRHSIELIFTAVFCVFLQQVVLLEPRMKISQMMDRLGTKLAAFSYTLYLVHILVMRVLQHYGAERPVVLSLKAILLWMAWCGIALIVSYGIYWCFERHTYRVKNYLKRLINFNTNKNI